MFGHILVCQQSRMYIFSAIILIVVVIQLALKDGVRIEECGAREVSVCRAMLPRLVSTLALAATALHRVRIIHRPILCITSNAVKSFVYYCISDGSATSLSIGLWSPLSQDRPRYILHAAIPRVMRLSTTELTSRAISSSAEQGQSRPSIESIHRVLTARAFAYSAKRSPLSYISSCATSTPSPSRSLPELGLP